MHGDALLTYLAIALSFLQVFKGKEFHPIGSLSENVPVLTCGGISKRFLVPGWRCGWLALHDRMGVLTNASCNSVIEDTLR